MGANRHWFFVVYFGYLKLLVRGVGWFSRFGSWFMFSGCDLSVSGCEGFLILLIVG